MIKTAVVLAGGRGTRLRPLTYVVPKPLVPVGNVPLLAHIIRLLSLHGIERVVVVVNYLGEDIADYVSSRKWGTLVEICDEKPIDTADAVRKCCEMIPSDEDFFVVMGDVLTNIDLTGLAKFHLERKADATISLKNVDNPLEYGLVLLDNDNKIELFLEKPLSLEIYLMTLAYYRRKTRSHYANYVNTGFYVLSPCVLRILKEEPYLMDFGSHVFPYLLENGYRVFGWDMGSSYWRDLGRPKMYLEANRNLLERRVEPLQPRGELKDPAGIWVAGELELEPEAIIIPPVAIGSNVRMGSKAVVGPYVSIGDNCIISPEARIRNSVIWSDVKVGPKTIIDGSIVASDVVVGAGARLGTDTVIGHGSVIKDGTTLTSKVVPPTKALLRRNAEIIYDVS
ncbi:MAG TPA: NDP-sugar synthase [Thermofilum sp.]|nr:NDP-sugar synthase [Thermofilum sp.]